MASYKIEILALEEMSNDTTKKLYEIYFNFLNGNDSFPYSDVEKLLNRYQLLYDKTFRERFLQRFLNTGNKVEIRNDCVRLSKNQMLINVSRKILGLVYLDVFKYVPRNASDRDLVFNKLFPILKNFSPYEIAEIYTRFKISASIRGVIIDNDSMARLQQIFVVSIMSVLSNNKDSDNSLCNYDFVCERIINEDNLNVDCKKNIR